MYQKLSEKLAKFWRYQKISKVLRCSEALKTRCVYTLMCAHLLKTLKTRWRLFLWRLLKMMLVFRGNKWLQVLLPPLHVCMIYMLVFESLFLSKSVRQDSAAASLWCSNDSLQSFVGWLKGYFSQKFPKGEIVRFLRVLASFAKISLWSKCGVWCAHIWDPTRTSYSNAPSDI
jgi:hypothetical protein